MCVLTSNSWLTFLLHNCRAERACTPTSPCMLHCKLSGPTMLHIVVSMLPSYHAGGMDTTMCNIASTDILQWSLHVTPVIRAHCRIGIAQVFVVCAHAHHAPDNAPAVPQKTSNAIAGHRSFIASHRVSTMTCHEIHEIPFSCAGVI